MTNMAEVVQPDTRIIRNFELITARNIGRFASLTKNIIG